MKDQTKKNWWIFWKTKNEKYNEEYQIGFTTATFILNKGTEESTNFPRLFKEMDKETPKDDGMRFAIRIWEIQKLAREQ